MFYLLKIHVYKSPSWSGGLNLDSSSPYHLAHYTFTDSVYNYLYNKESHYDSSVHTLFHQVQISADEDFFSHCKYMNL